MRGVRPAPPSVLDVVGAGLLAVLLGPLSVLFAGVSGAWPGTPAGVLAAALASAALVAGVLLARTRPGLALGLAWVGAIAQMGAGLPPLPISIAVLVPLFWTGASTDRRVRLAGLISAVVGAVAMTAYLVAPSVLATPETAAIGAGVLLVAGTVSFVLAWTLGLLWTTLRATRRAREEALIEAERGRIAREMHDVVAHSLAVVIAQADGARYASAADPERAREGLETVAGVARESLADVRRLLAGLRHSQGDGLGPDASQPGLADLEPMAAAVREAGLEVVLDAGTPPAAVPAGTQLAVHRIVQECLTNALRHGRRDRPALVRIAWDQSGVGIRVDSAVDPGRPPSGVAGHGITGMRERARIAGGSLAVGPDATGDRFIAEARLPLVPVPEGVR